VQAIRCPQCGLINHTDDITFPRCGQCQEDLVRCTACEYLQGNVCTLPAGKAHFTADMNGAKFCPKFSSRYVVHGPRLFWHIPAPVWVSGLLLLIMLSLALGSWFIDPLWRIFRGNPLTLQVLIPEQVTLGKSAIVSLRVINRVNRASTRITLEIGDEFRQAVQLGNPAPPPSHIGVFNHHLLLEYDPLPAQGQLVVELPFVPRMTGAPRFGVRAYAPSNQLQQEVVAPIIILPAIHPLSSIGKGVLHER